MVDTTLVIGAGVTGCHTAALLQDKGLDVALLARGEKADRLANEGLRMRDGISGDERTVRLRIVQSPVTETYDLAMVCVQETHRPSLEPLLRDLPGAPTIWFLGNTTKGFNSLGKSLGRDRVLGGFPSVGGTWEDDVLVYADREKASERPFDKLVLGEAFPEGASAAEEVRARLVKAGIKVEHHVPIMAWHWSHIALVLPLAGAFYHHDGNLQAVVADNALLKQTMRATAQAFAAVARSGYPVLPRGLRVMRWIPAVLGARRIASLLDSKFGRVALAGHASNARAEMQSLADDLRQLAGPQIGKDLRATLDAVAAPTGLRPAV